VAAVMGRSCGLTTEYPIDLWDVKQERARSQKWLRTALTHIGPVEVGSKVDARTFASC